MMSYTGHEFIEELKRLEQRLSYELRKKSWRGEPKRTIYKGLNSRKRRRNQLYFNRLVEANGLTWDDIMDEKRTTRTVKYANQDEFKILVNLLAHLFGSKSDTFQKATFNKRKKEIYFDLTDVEAADVESMWSYYRRELKSGLKKAKREFLDAFIYKFNLYNITPDENRENKLSFEDLMRLKMIADGIESSPYAKMIGHGNR